MKYTAYYPKSCIRSKQKPIINTWRGNSSAHLGTGFDEVGDGVLLGECDSERVWTPACFGSTASCDCAGISAITSRGGLPSRSSCCVVVLAVLACTPASGAGLSPAALDVEAPPRFPPHQTSSPKKCHRKRADRGYCSRASRAMTPL